MKTSEQTNEIASALSKAQGEMRNPEKNRTAEIVMKSGGVYSYKYADLPITIDTAREALMKYGLSHSAGTSPTEHGTLLSMRLAHNSGQWYESEIMLPPSSDPKGFAANFTYFRRYLFTSLIGLAADEDVDAGPEDRNESSKSKNKQPQTGSPQGNSKVVPPVSPKNPTPKPKLAGIKERDHILRLSKENGWEKQDVVNCLTEVFGKKTVQELTMPEYQELAVKITTHKPSDFIGEFEAMGTTVGSTK